MLLRQLKSKTKQRNMNFPCLNVNSVRQTQFHNSHKKIHADKSRLVYLLFFLNDYTIYLFIVQQKMSNEKTKPSLLKQAALQIVAGGSAGFVEVCIMHPLDLVKTRLQIQNKKSSINSTPKEVVLHQF